MKLKKSTARPYDEQVYSSLDTTVSLSFDAIRNWLTVCTPLLYKWKPFVAKENGGSVSKVQHETQWYNRQYNKYTDLERPTPDQTLVLKISDGGAECAHGSLEVSHAYPGSKVHWANIGPIWGRQDPGGPHVGPMNFDFMAHWQVLCCTLSMWPLHLWMVRK